LEERRKQGRESNQKTELSKTGTGRGLRDGCGAHDGSFSLKKEERENELSPMGYLIAGGVALGWAVVRMGPVLPADRFTAALAFGAIALSLFLVARQADLAPRLSPWIRWQALRLPAYRAIP
jgi:hypothetical protein